MMGRVRGRMLAVRRVRGARVRRRDDIAGLYFILGVGQEQ